MKVYLAGTITGLTAEDAIDWREEFTRKARIDSEGRLVCASPMRLKDHLRGTGVINGDEIVPGGFLDTARAVVQRDIFDVRTCDVVVMNIAGADRISVGTMVELGLATAWRKFVILVMDEGNIHEHIFTRECASIVVPTLADAHEVLLAL